MVFIVSGHLNSGGLNLAFNIFPPYSFHVGAFVFISGYFYKAEKEKHPKEYLSARFKRLIIPLYLINALYGVWAQIAHGIGFRYGGPLTIYNVLLDPLFGGHAFAWDLPLWFVAPLFFTQLIYFCVRKLFHLSSRADWPLFCIFLLLGIASAWFFGPGGVDGRFPLLVLLARIAYFLPCYSMGQLYRTHIEERDTVSNIKYFSILIGIQICILIVCAGKITFVPSWGQYSSSPIIPFAVTATGIAFWLRVSKMLGPVIGKSKVVLAIANNNYSIMAHQMFAIVMVQLAIYFLSLLVPITSFDSSQFFSSIWYSWVPGRIANSPDASAAFRTVYLAAGIGVPILMHAVWSWIRDAAQNYFHLNRHC